MAFETWLFWQTGRPDATGDFARDVVFDEQKPKTSAFPAWRTYLVEAGAGKPEVAAFIRVWAEWKSGQS